MGPLLISVSKNKPKVSADHQTNHNCFPAQILFLLGFLIQSGSDDPISFATNYREIFHGQLHFDQNQTQPIKKKRIPQMSFVIQRNDLMQNCKLLVLSLVHQFFKAKKIIVPEIINFLPIFTTFPTKYRDVENFW